MTRETSSESVSETTEEVAEIGDDSAMDGSAEVVALLDDSVVAAGLPMTPANPVGAIRYVALLLLLAGGVALVAAAILGQRLLQSGAASVSPVAEPRRTP